MVEVHCHWLVTQGPSWLTPASVTSLLAHFLPTFPIFLAHFTTCLSLGREIQEVVLAVAGCTGRHWNGRGQRETGGLWGCPSTRLCSTSFLPHGWTKASREAEPQNWRSLDLDVTTGKATHWPGTSNWTLQINNFAKPPKCGGCLLQQLAYPD